MKTDAQKRKELREQYAARRPDKGIVCWKSGDRVWVMPSGDAHADYNSTSFQLKLGSWPNREMQSAYSAAPDSFVWSVAEQLDYDDPTEDYSDDLALLLRDYMERHPEAKLMKPLKNRLRRNE